VSASQWRLNERYEVFEQVGAGASATAWRGRDQATGTECAVKVLRSELLREPGAVNRFYDVLGAVARLGHPGIVAVQDAVPGDGWLALVSRLVPGESLRSLSAQHGAIAPHHCVPLIAQLCDALAAAHAAGLAHGAPTAPNVLLEPGSDGIFVARLTDFGIAALANEAASAGANVPTAPPAEYLAPELAPAQPATAAADVYAAGVLLYEVLSGRPPFSAPSPAELAELHRYAPPAPIAGLSGALWLALADSLEKDPRQRPSAAELAEALRVAASPDGIARPGTVRPAGPAATPMATPVTPFVTAQPAAAVPAPASDATRLLPPVVPTPAPDATRLLAPVSPAGGLAGLASQFGEWESDAGQPSFPLSSRSAPPSDSRLPRLVREHRVELGIAAAIGVCTLVVVSFLALNGGGRANAASSSTSAGSATASASASPSMMAVVLPSASPASPSASAAPSVGSFGGTNLADSLSGTCMHTRGSAYADGTIEEISACQSDPSQSWTFTATGQLTQDNGAFCLDDFGFGSTPGTAVGLWSCNGGSNQQWTILTNGSIVSTSNGLCVDLTSQATADGTALVLETCDSRQTSQLWSWH